MVYRALNQLDIFQDVIEALVWNQPKLIVDQIVLDSGRLPVLKHTLIMVGFLINFGHSLMLVIAVHSLLDRCHVWDLV